MPDILGGPSTSKVLRWTTFVIVEANAAFMYLYANRAGELPSMAEVSKHHATAFAPADYVTVINWIIGAAVLLFYVAAVWPRHRRTRIYDPFVAPLAIASTLGSAWVVAMRNEQIDLTVALTVAGFVLAAMMFARAVASPSLRPRWLRVPFALVFGWATFVLLVSTAQWFNAREWLTTIEMVTEMSLGFLAIAAVIGGFIALRYREFVYPMVMAWGVGGIYVGQRTVDPTIASAALAVCIGLLIVAAFASLAVAIEPFRRKEGPPASRRAEKRKHADRVAPAARARFARASRWPKFLMPSHWVIEPQHRRYLLDLDTATTRT